MTPQRRSKAIDDYPSKFDWPSIKGLNHISKIPSTMTMVEQDHSPKPKSDFNCKLQVFDLYLQCVILWWISTILTRSLLCAEVGRQGIFVSYPQRVLCTFIKKSQSWSARFITRMPERSGEINLADIHIPDWFQKTLLLSSASFCLTSRTVPEKELIARIVRKTWNNSSVPRLYMCNDPFICIFYALQQFLLV